MIISEFPAVSNTSLQFFWDLNKTFQAWQNISENIGTICTGILASNISVLCCPLFCILPVQTINLSSIHPSIAKQ